MSRLFSITDKEVHADRERIINEVFSHLLSEKLSISDAQLVFERVTKKMLSVELDSELAKKPESIDGSTCRYLVVPSQ